MKGVTAYQLELLTTLRAIQSAAGALADMDQLLERLSWTPSKESLQFSIRALIAKGLIEKAGIETRRGRNRICYQMTVDGKAVLDPRPERREKLSETEAEEFRAGTSKVASMWPESARSGAS